MIRHPDETEGEAPTKVLNEYYAAFSTLIVPAILPYFHEPSAVIGPAGVYTLPNHDALAEAFTPVMEGLRCRGFGRSELNVEKVLELSPTAALIGGVALRYKVDGQELERVGVTYVLHKSVTWKIAVLVIHDPS